MDDIRAYVEHIMGTAISIAVPRETAPDAVMAAFALLREADDIYSTYKADSYVSRLRDDRIALDDCPNEVLDVIAMCVSLQKETGGYFDAWAGSDGFDPSGLVKGWAAERASDLLADAGVRRHCVNAGGDVKVRGGRDDAGRTPWRIGISDPLRPGELAAVVANPESARPLAVATSGIAERGAHVIDPVRGEPAVALASVTVVGPTLAMADAYATAAVAMGVAARRWLPTLEGYEALVIDAGGEVWHTLGFGRFTN